MIDKMNLVAHNERGEAAIVALTVDYKSKADVHTPYLRTASDLRAEIEYRLSSDLAKQIPLAVRKLAAALEKLDRNIVLLELPDSVTAEQVKDFIKALGIPADAALAV